MLSVERKSRSRRPDADPPAPCRSTINGTGPAFAAGGTYNKASRSRPIASTENPGTGSDDGSRGRAVRRPVRALASCEWPNEHATNNSSTAGPIVREPPEIFISRENAPIHEADTGPGPPFWGARRQILCEKVDCSSLFRRAGATRQAQRFSNETGRRPQPHLRFQQFTGSRTLAQAGTLHGSRPVTSFPGRSESFTWPT